jgi:hypothetical protein
LFGRKSRELADKCVAPGRRRRIASSHNISKPALARGLSEVKEVATVITTTTKIAAFGHGRPAASVRLRTVAPISWMSGVGVCPSPVQLLADLPSARVDAIGIDVAGNGVRFAEQLSTYLSRTFDKHDPGSTHLRPPV